MLNEDGYVWCDGCGSYIGNVDDLDKDHTAPDGTFNDQEDDSHLCDGCMERVQ